MSTNTTRGFFECALGIPIFPSRTLYLRAKRRERQGRGRCTGERDVYLGKGRLEREGRTVFRRPSVDGETAPRETKPQVLFPVINLSWAHSPVGRPFPLPLLSLHCRRRPFPLLPPIPSFVSCSPDEFRASPMLPLSNLREPLIPSPSVV